MLALLQTECSKFYRWRGAYAGFLLLLAMAGFFVLPAALDAKHQEARLKRQVEAKLGDEFVVAGKVMSGVFVPRVILFLQFPVYVFVGSAVAMAAGGALSTEYASGTLRTLLTRPVRRTSVVLAKWVVHSFHAAALTLFLGAASLALGYLFLGSGDLVWAIEQRLEIVPEREALLRVAAGFGVQCLSMISVASIALFASSAVSRGATAAGLTVGFLMLCGMAAVIPLDTFKAIQPYLLTTHMSALASVATSKPNWPEVHRALFWIGGYSAAALIGALITFSRREIRC